jgi:hypothetical protein
MSREETLYAILKADLAHYGQLLEHPFVIDELKSFAQHRWTELAYSGGITFRSALAQPCNKLAATEVCVPTMPDGADYNDTLNIYCSQPDTWREQVVG